MWWVLSFGLTMAAPVNGVTDAASAVVVVEQGRTFCSGALVSETGEVLTAYHCVVTGGQPRVTLRDGTSAVGRVIRVSAARDLAWIAVPELAGQPYLGWVDAQPAVGADVWAIGHPFGSRPPAGFMDGTLRWSTTEGIVSAVGNSTVQFSAPINPGNSGGPLVDEDGAIVAVVSRRAAGGEGLGFGSHVVSTLETLDWGRPMGPLGGTLGFDLRLTSWSRGLGAVSLGGAAVLALRDRVVFSGVARWGASSRWDALRFDESTWLGPEARGGLRQRVGRGSMALQLDGYGGVVSELTLRNVGEAEEVRFAREQRWLGVIGGEVRMGMGGLDLSYAPGADAWSAGVVLSWPGVFTVF